MCQCNSQLDLIINVGHSDLDFMVQWFCFIPWWVVHLRTLYFAIMSRVIDLIINVDHSDLYFMVRWFCFITWRVFDLRTPYSGLISHTLTGSAVITHDVTYRVRVPVYRIRGPRVYPAYLFTNCVTRSFDLLDRFSQTCIGSTSWRVTGTLQWPDSVTNFSKMFLL